MARTNGEKVFSLNTFGLLQNFYYLKIRMHTAQKMKEVRVNLV